MNHATQILQRRFVLSLGISAFIFVAELAGGFWTGSLALLSDSAHVFLDFFALAFSYIALRVSALPADDRHTFGWHRLEVFAGLANGITLFAVTITIFYEAWQRIKSPVVVHSAEMLVIAVIGLIANLMTAQLLKEHHQLDLNVHSAFLHVVGDALSSVGVIVGGIVMLFTGWMIIDPIISVLICIFLFMGSWRVVRSSLHILFEGTPEGLSLSEVARAISEIEGVREVHDLHIWSICSGYPALSVHVCADFDGTTTERLSAIKKLLQERFGIEHTTIQIDSVNCGQGSSV
ncbi:MAG: cation diffusion facilitator family transporter [Ignavibacteriales bacterium]|nr:cation diffusion facilitator family transporter [Ignavibacteriales bacterium]